MQEQLITQYTTPPPITNDPKKIFFRNPKFITILILLFILFFVFLASGGHPVADISCIAKRTRPLAGFNGDPCITQMGSEIRLVQMCNLFTRNEDAGMCKGAYAVENNRLDICLSLSSNNMTQQPLCLEKYAIKSNDINVCDKVTPQNTSGFITETCRNSFNYHNGIKVFENDYMGFQIVIPDPSWQLPLGSWDWLTFYKNKECLNIDNYNCLMLLIFEKVNDNNSKYAELLKAYNIKHDTSIQNAKELTSLISGAIITKGYPPEKMKDRWKFAYNIFFSENKKEFILYSNDENLEKNVIPSFRLIKHNPLNSSF